MKMQAKVNSETIHRIRKRINKEIKFEEDFRSDVERLMQKVNLTIMGEPLVRRMAAKYHEASAPNRRKAIEEHHKTRMKVYQVKGNGPMGLVQAP